MHFETLVYHSKWDLLTINRKYHNSLSISDKGLYFCTQFSLLQARPFSQQAFRLYTQKTQELRLFYPTASACTISTRCPVFMNNHEMAGSQSCLLPVCCFSGHFAVHTPSGRLKTEITTVCLSFSNRVGNGPV